MQTTACMCWKGGSKQHPSALAFQASCVPLSAAYEASLLTGVLVLRGSCSGCCFAGAHRQIRQHGCCLW